MYNIYTNNNSKQYQPGGQYIPAGYGGQQGYDSGGWSTGPSLMSMSTGSPSASSFDVSAYSGKPYGYSYGGSDTLTGLPSSLIAYGAQKARQINDQLGLSTMFANLHAILTMPFIPSSKSSGTGNYGSSSYTGASSSSGSSGSSSSSSSSASSGSSDSSGSSGSAGSTGSSGSSSSSASSASSSSSGSKGSSGSGRPVPAAGNSSSSGSSASSGSAASAGSAGSSLSSGSSNQPIPATGGLFSGGKEGLGINETSSNGDGSNLASTKASWYYNWSPNASSKVNDPNATFIPMIWGKGNMNAKDLEAAKSSASPMILTFNEPDHGEQATMSVDEALGYWDQLEATGKQLSSPAVTNGPNGVIWIDEFMSKAATAGKRVDSISLHWYGSSAQPTADKVAALKDYIESVHKKYPDKPINLTEFGVDASGLTAGKDQAFLTEAEKMLNGLDYVQMYAPYGTGDINGN